MLKKVPILFAVSLLALSCSRENRTQISTEPVQSDDVLTLGQPTRNDVSTQSEQLGLPNSIGIPVKLGEPFELEPGDRAVLEGSGLKITFNGVLFNNRCPGDVTCIWQGEAVIGVEVTMSGTTTDLSLKIDGLTGDLTGPSQHTVAYGGFRFTLLNLDPYPLVFPPDDYDPGPDRARLLLLAD